jgi:hypothetical protein
MIVIDPLRITDALFKKLLSFFENLDNNSSFDLEKRPYLKRFNSFLIDKLRVSNPIYIS